MGGNAQQAVLADEEGVAVLAVVALGDAEEPARRSQHDILLRVDVAAAVHRQLVGRVDEERAEKRDDPLEALHQLDAGEDEQQPHHDRAEDPPEENPILVHQGNREEAEDDHEDEDIVHRERFLDQIARQIDAPDLMSRPPPDQTIEDQRQADPEDRPPGRLLERGRVIVSMEYQQIQRQKQDDQHAERKPVPKMKFGQFSSP